MYQPSIMEFVRGGQAVRIEPAIDAAKRMLGAVNVQIWGTDSDGVAVNELWHADTNDIDQSLRTAAKVGGFKLVIYDEKLLETLVSARKMEFSFANGMFTVQGASLAGDVRKVSHKDLCAAIATYLHKGELYPSTTEIVVERCAWVNTVYEYVKDQNTLTFWRDGDLFGVKVWSTSAEYEGMRGSTELLIEDLSDMLQE